jgi:hypothetical protein
MVKILGAAFMFKGTIGESQESSIKKKKRKWRNILRQLLDITIQVV